MSELIYLHKFKPEELIFDEEETRIILRFIFMHQHAVINRMKINDRAREFAQGLLVEAIDASYAMGYVKILFTSLLQPKNGVKGILKSL